MTELESLLEWAQPEDKQVLEVQKEENTYSVYGGEIEQYSIKFRTEDGFEIVGSLYRKKDSEKTHGHGLVAEHGVTSSLRTFFKMKDHMLEHTYDWIFTPNTPGHYGSTMNRKKATMENFAKAIGEVVEYLYSGDSEIIPQIDGKIIWTANSAHAPMAIEGSKLNDKSVGVILSSPVYNPENTAFAGKIKLIKRIARFVPDRILNVAEKATRTYAKKHAKEAEEKEIHMTRKVEIPNKDLYKSITAIEKYHKKLVEQIGNGEDITGGIDRLVIYNNDDQLSFKTDDDEFNPGAFYLETPQGIGHHPHKRVPLIYAIAHKVARDLFSEDNSVRKMDSKEDRESLFYHRFQQELSRHVTTNGNGSFSFGNYVDDESRQIILGSLDESYLEIN
ncbi:MAG: hypothetical protein GOU98_00660 [Candidatus Altiarchaeota archaeon]|nr:hypothetical protein [Candidatus Altiarchaeota archaeon]